MESDCLFCQIIQGRTPADVVFRSGSVVAFKDIHPHAPTHILIVPVKHIRSVNDLTEKDRPIMADLFMTARMLAAEFGIAESGYKLLFNVERGGGQVIFHLHLHLLGGW